MTGRFAPSPTGSLHVGNLRTALLGWLVARSGVDRTFLVRMEDLDRVTSSPEHEADQLATLEALGIDWDPPVIRQSERFDRYHDAIGTLGVRGLTYECFCTRREIHDAVAAPNGPTAPGRGYPGTCRRLTAAERGARRAERPPAIRLRAGHEVISFVDALVGPVTGRADDVVLRRNDGVPAYNLAVVVDDGAQGITEVVRGDDLVPSTPSQILLQRLLGLPEPRYVHVPLVVGGDGRRLAKRHGAVTLDDLVGQGVPAGRVVAALGASLGVHGAVPAQMLDDFDLAAVCAVGRDPVALGDLEQAWG